MVVLGHSGATGWNSDPADPRVDAKENSWATGTNPDVDSIYARLLDQNPSLEAHNFNAAQSGSDVTDLPNQVAAALKYDPVPDLFIIQSVDNDIRCDGTDGDNYEPYGNAMADVLTTITTAAPDAQIVVVGLWATVQNFSDVTKELPVAVSANQDGSPCAVFDAAGNELPEVVAYYQDVIDHYQAQLQASCEKFPSCRYGGDAVRNMVIDAADLTPDTNHLSITGQAKLAETVWTALYA